MASYNYLYRVELQQRSQWCLEITIERAYWQTFVLQIIRYSDMFALKKWDLKGN